MRRRRGSCWEERKRIVYPQLGVIDLPSRQINDFFITRKQKNELLVRPENLLVPQLTVATSGPVKLDHVVLNARNINGMLEDSEVPMELMDGYIGQLSVSVPWSNLLNDNCQVVCGHSIDLTIHTYSSLYGPCRGPK